MSSVQPQLDRASGLRPEVVTTHRNDECSLQQVEIDSVRWNKIIDSHRMPEFFMSIVSASDHWMFISSLGALTAGRKNADSALFPYYSADKIIDLAETVGPKTIVRVVRPNQPAVVWEPFGVDSVRSEGCTRNLYKNSLGSRVMLEEIHPYLEIAFRYSWSMGQEFGFIRRCEIVNLGSTPIQVEVADGLQNLLPSGIGNKFQLRFSNLGDAYKKSERLPETGLGLFYLSSIPTDRAEPSEGLRTTVAWQHGLTQPRIALSNESLENFRCGKGLSDEHDVRGKRGAYFVSTKLHLLPGQPVRWALIADVNYDHSDVARLESRLIEGQAIDDALDRDVQANEQRLIQILAASDGCQLSADVARSQRHQSNVLFNVMRGGIPANGYFIDTLDFRSHVRNANRHVAQRNENLLASLSVDTNVQRLQSQVLATGDADLIRIAFEYLPLCFSRRHGDPTRPWNEFSIDTRSADGTEKLNYQGNWRDIFQNWEALGISYPRLISGMVLRFVNSSTADGYNPYRISKNDFEWEVPDPHEPWSNIGYWGDHQIIYLLKLLEWARAITPDGLQTCFASDICTYADVPYRIRDYADLCRDPQETIDFDFDHAAAIQQRVDSMGSDGKYLYSNSAEPLHVGFIEKLLVPVLAKLTNFVPGGGVWLNTQRPEWNDANNALVGRGLSMVTACYLRRYLTFLVDWLNQSSPFIPGETAISSEVWSLARRLNQTMVSHADCFRSSLDDNARKQILDELAGAGSDYRKSLYQDGLSGSKEVVSMGAIVELLQHATAMIDHTIRANRRDDGMYHSYNLLSLTPNSAKVSHLYEMLEGQVAILSSGLLDGRESLEVLDSLRHSKMYRADQGSYMLYPDRELPRFMEKNCITRAAIGRSKLLGRLVEASDSRIIRQDVRGECHFAGDFRNASDLKLALDKLSRDPRYADLVEQDRDFVLETFEETFSHRNFTGRSGTFFGYEGLGSIYWHMVSKLALAVMEQCIRIRNESREDRAIVLARLLDHYREIRHGIGFAKTPAAYGAFPSDPYSHTPRGAGVQQPGMTGQVKEDILTRWLELGLRYENGQLKFDPAFFEVSEFLKAPSKLDYIDVTGVTRSIPISQDSFAMTICQVPVIYCRSHCPGITVHYLDRLPTQRAQLELSHEESQSLVSRSGEITRIEVRFDPDQK